MMNSAARCCTVVCVSALVACAGEVPVVEVAGECANVHGAEVCTWARMQGDALVDMGATIPLASVEQAPRDVQMAWPPAALATLELPAAAQSAGGLTHMTLYWEPTGHPPATYMAPHFDFHFYKIPEADRLAIDCSDLSKPAALPEAYSLPDEVLPEEVAAMIGVSTLVGVCVPEMGMHSLPTAEIESSNVFSSTMVIGYYRGRNIFVEPMVTQALLRQRASFDLDLPAIPGVEGPHPSSFRAEYDADLDAYRFVFSGPSAAALTMARND